MSTRSGFTFSVCVAAVAAVFAVSAIAPAHAQERKPFRWATSNVGSYGYKVAAAMTKLIEEALGGEYTVTVHPYRSTTAAKKDAMDGNAEMGYTADIGMRELYDGNPPYKDYKAKVARLVHTWYAYPMESFMAAPAATAGKFKCWRDFSGKPVFYTTAGFMNWSNWRRIYKVLGYEFKHVEIDTATNADALQSGSIVGSASYTTAGRSLAAYWRETELRTDFKLVNPCPDEVKKLTAAGLTPVPVDTTKAFSKDVGVKEVLGVQILFAYNVRPDMPEDVVYKILTGLYKNKDKLVAADPGFTPLAADFVGMQVRGINVNPDIPVHPGLAKFLKEHKAWNDKWKISTATTK
ncbi:MAG: immunogenic protein [Betaproteobacteria bacterium]|nr:immunogenic protein [Betaproteobacteria bacterium]